MYIKYDIFAKKTIYGGALILRICKCREPFGVRDLTELGRRVGMGMGMEMETFHHNFVDSLINGIRLLVLALNPIVQ